ncbi:MAG: chromosome segregation ATPase [Flavobacteriales bacterium]|jgi:chromosome segregation ATPase
MKNLAILLLLCAPIFTLSQQKVTNSKHASSTSEQEQKSNRLDANKLEKVVVRNTKLIAKMQQESKEMLRTIDCNEKQQVENVSETAIVKASMNGHELDPLEDQIDRLEKDKRKLNSKTEQNENAIIRKKARFEKMLAEIEMMQGQIVENDNDLVGLNDDIRYTQETITSNGLVDKDKSLLHLEKNLKSLKKKNQRQNNRLLKTQDQINKSTSDLRSTKIEIQNLNNKNAFYESRGEIPTNSQSN